MKNVQAILTSDWHLREDTPVCRTDDFWVAQWAKVEEVIALAAEYDCTVIHAGDLFHHWKPSPYLLSTAMRHIFQPFVTVYGQHDLPQHNLELSYKSGVYTLHQSGSLTIWDGGHWGKALGEMVFPIADRTVGVWHKFVWDGEKIPWPGCEEQTARQVLKANPNFDLIVTGDHHKPFVYEYRGRLLVNPGCLTRQAADYAAHRPRVYLWDAEDNTVEPHYLEIDSGSVSRHHIEVQQQRDARLQAFIDRLSDDWEAGVSFEINLDRFLKKNKQRKTVLELIQKAIKDE